MSIKGFILGLVVAVFLFSMLNGNGGSIIDPSFGQALAYEASGSTNFWIHGGGLDSISGVASGSTNFSVSAAGGQAISGIASGSTNFFSYAGIMQLIYRGFAPNYTQSHFHWRNDDGLEGTTEAVGFNNTASSSPSNITDYSVRRVWYDGTRYWMLIPSSNGSGGNMSFVYSADGATWAQNRSAELNDNNRGPYKSHIEGDSTNAFIVYEDVTPSLWIRAASASSGYPGNGFNWGVKHQIQSNVGTFGNVGPVSMTRDTNNKILIAWIYDANGSSSIKFTSSVNANSVSSFNAISTVTMGIPSSGSNRAIILPLAGGNYYIVYYDAVGGNVKGSKWDGNSWSAPVTIGAAVSAFTAVSDISANNIYLAFNDTSTNVKFLKYTDSNTTWSGSTNIATISGGASFQLSLNRSTGNIYLVFYNSAVINWVTSSSPFSSWSSSATLVASATGAASGISVSDQPLNGNIITEYPTGTGPYNWQAVALGVSATSATAGVQDTSLGSMALNTAKRLRVEISNEGGDAGISDQQFRIEYGAKATTCAAASYIDVGAVGGDWDMADSTNLTDGGDTTNITTTVGGVTDSNGSFLSPNGAIKDTSSTVSAKTLDSTAFVELEYSIKPIGSASGNYCFRVTNAGTATGYTYSTYAESNVSSAASLTLSINSGGVVSFGSITVGNNRKTSTTNLLVTQTGATSLNITAGRQRAITNVTLASNANSTLVANRISDTGGGIDVFNTIATCPTAGSHPAIWPSQTGTSSGLGFTLWKDSNSSKDTSCWGAGTAESDSLNRYVALQASNSASSFITISSSVPATLYTSIGYSLEVPTSQKATIYNGAVVYTVTSVP